MIPEDNNSEVSPSQRLPPNENSSPSNPAPALEPIEAQPIQNDPQSHKNGEVSLHRALQDNQNGGNQQIGGTLQSPPADSRLSMFKQFAEVKIQENAQQPYVCRSKRKVRPTEPVERQSLEEVVQLMDAGSAQCHILFQRKGRKGVTGPSAAILDPGCQWIFHQQFYSSVDRNYFREEPLRRLLGEGGVSSEQRTYQEQRMIRQALPAPKTFNFDFLCVELQRLADSRAQVRAIPRQKGREWELAVGKEVIALHPVCGHLHAGSILAIYKENQYMVKFQRLELGTQKVLDVFMTPRETSTHQRVVIESVDYDVMALAIRLLEYKAQLLALMKEFNLQAESIQRSEGSFSNTFFQEYGWLGSTINILSLGIRHVIAKFRIRGLTGANQEKVGKNFGSILVNPLRPIERILNKSNESSDRHAREQIELLLNSHKDSRTEQVTRELCEKYGAGIKRSEMGEEEKEEMERLLKSMIGLLVHLRYQSRHFSLQDNKHLNELMNAIDTRYPEHFNEIYETLHSITGKVSEEPKES